MTKDGLGAAAAAVPAAIRPRTTSADAEVTRRRDWKKGREVEGFVRMVHSPRAPTPRDRIASARHFPPTAAKSRSNFARYFRRRSASLTERRRSLDAANRTRPAADSELDEAHTPSLMAYAPVGFLDERALYSENLVSGVLRGD